MAKKGGINEIQGCPQERENRGGWALLQHGVDCAQTLRKAVGSPPRGDPVFIVLSFVCSSINSAEWQCGLSDTPHSGD